MDYAANKHLFCTPTGKRLTVGLFFETARTEEVEAEPHFYLAEWRKRYVEIADPTGYIAAMELMGDWEHWMFLRTSKAFSAIMDGWDKEVEVKLRSAAIKNLIVNSKSEKGQASAKWLAEAGFKMNVDKRKKDVKLQEEAIVKEVASKVADDMERLGLKVVVGGK